MGGVIWGLCLAGSAVAGTPWIHPAGEGYVKVSEQRFVSEGFVSPDGTVQADTRYVGWSTAAYAEAGLGRGLQAMATVPVVSARNEVAGASFVQRGFGDAVVAVAGGRSLGAGLPAALTLQTRLPLYDNAELAGFGATGGRFPALGDGQIDVDLLGSVGTGWSVGGRRGWWMAELGLRHRTEVWLGDRSEPPRELGDGVLGRVQVGWSPRGRTGSLGWLVSELAVVKALQPSPATREVLDLGLGGAWALDPRLAVELRASTLLWTVAAAPGAALGVGVSRRGPWKAPSPAAGG